ncbi:MAG: hypothetical protein ACREYE_00810 [Gammaproteobacteria bacterium]
MDIFAKLFGGLLVFVYHCFDRIVVNGYLSGLSRPEQVVYFFREVVGVSAVTKEVLSGRTGDYQGWVESFARNHEVPIEWGEKGVRKEKYVLRWQRSMERRGLLHALCGHGPLFAQRLQCGERNIVPVSKNQRSFSRVSLRP